jgi:hypothetical protein
MSSQALRIADCLLSYFLPPLGVAKIRLLHAHGQAPQHLGGAQHEKHIRWKVLNPQFLDGAVWIERVNPAARDALPSVKQCLMIGPLHSCKVYKMSLHVQAR